MKNLKIQLFCLVASLCLTQATVWAIETPNNPCLKRTACHREIYENWKEWWQIRHDQSPMDYALSNQANDAIKKCAHEFGRSLIGTDRSAKRDCLRGARQEATKAGDHIIAEAITRDLMKDEKVGGMTNNPKVTVPVTVVGTMGTFIALNKIVLPALTKFLVSMGYSR